MEQLYWDIVQKKKKYYFVTYIVCLLIAIFTFSFTQRKYIILYFHHEIAEGKIIKIKRGALSNRMDRIYYIFYYGNNVIENSFETPRYIFSDSYKINDSLTFLYNSNINFSFPKREFPNLLTIYIIGIFISALILLLIFERIKIEVKDFKKRK